MRIVITCRPRNGRVVVMVVLEERKSNMLEEERWLGIRTVGGQALWVLLPQVAYTPARAASRASSRSGPGLIHLVVTVEANDALHCKCPNCDAAECLDAGWHNMSKIADFKRRLWCDERRGSSAVVQADEVDSCESRLTASVFRACSSTE